MPDFYIFNLHHVKTNNNANVLNIFLIFAIIRFFFVEIYTRIALYGYLFKFASRFICG